MSRFFAPLLLGALLAAQAARAVESVATQVENDYRKQRQAMLASKWFEQKAPDETASSYLARLLDAARESDSRATAALGWEFQQRGDPLRARTWLGRAAERGNPFAAYLLGLLAAQETPPADGDVLHVDWTHRAADEGLPEAQFEIALRNAQGKSGAPDLVAARSWYGLAADQDFAPAQCNLATLEVQGAGGPVEMDKAKAHFEAAAKAGFPQGYFGMGEVLRMQNRNADAAREYQRASEAGIVEADFWLGCFASQGLGQTKDDTEAAKHFMKAALGGQPVAQAIMANLLRRGTGVKVDEPAANHWDAEIEGFTDFQVVTTIGQLYLEGRLVQRDPAKALHLLRRAAEHGQPNAQRLAGSLLATGEAGERDLQEAYQWLWLAAHNGQTEAESTFQAVLQAMDGNQIMEAARRASEFRPVSP